MLCRVTRHYLAVLQQILYNMAVQDDLLNLLNYELYSVCCWYKRWQLSINYFTFGDRTMHHAYN